MGVTQLSPSSQDQGSPSDLCPIHESPGEGVEPLLCSECLLALGSVPEHGSPSRAAETSPLTSFHFSLAPRRTLSARRVERLIEDLANVRTAAFHPRLAALACQGCVARREELSVVLLSRQRHWGATGDTGTSLLRPVAGLLLRRAERPVGQRLPAVCHAQAARAGWHLAAGPLCCSASAPGFLQADPEHGPAVAPSDQGG